MKNLCRNCKHFSRETICDLIVPDGKPIFFCIDKEDSELIKLANDIKKWYRVGVWLSCMDVPFEWTKCSRFIPYAPLDKLAERLNNGK